MSHSKNFFRISFISECYAGTQVRAKFLAISRLEPDLKETQQKLSETEAQLTRARRVEQRSSMEIQTLSSRLNQEIENAERNEAKYRDLDILKTKIEAVRRDRAISGVLCTENACKRLLNESAAMLWKTSGKMGPL